MIGRKTRTALGAVTLVVGLTTALVSPAAAANLASVSQEMSAASFFNCARGTNGVVKLGTNLPSSTSTSVQTAHLAVYGFRAVPGQPWQGIGWLSQEGGGYWLHQESGALRNQPWTNDLGAFLNFASYDPPAANSGYYYILYFYVQWADGQVRETWSKIGFC